ncbi:MAG: phosphotransferase family protein [Dehalococcoidia bacterium]
MDDDPVRDLEIAEIGLRIYGERPRVEKLYSENNYVCKLDFDGKLPAKVLKMAGGEHLYSSVRQEAVALGRLRDAGLAVPSLEHFWDEGTAPPWMILEFIAARDLGFAITNQLPWAEEGCRSAGAFLRDLHRAPVSIVEGFVPQHVPVTGTISWQHWSLVHAWDAADEPTREALTAVASSLDEQLQEPPSQVVHDSFVANHVLMDGGAAFAVNDWETIRAGYAERDLACFVGGLKAWLGGHDGHRDAFLDGYAGGLPWNRTRMAAWEVYYLMNWTAFALRHARAELTEHLIGLTKSTAVSAAKN